MASQELRGTSRLRSNDMPPDRLLLLRGGDRIRHEDEVLDLIDAAAAAGRRYTLDGLPFYSLSTFGVASGTADKDVLAALPLRRFPAVYRVRTGALYARGLSVWATFRTHINHFDVQLAAPSREQVELFLEAAGALQDNPYWRKERA